MVLSGVRLEFTDNSSSFFFWERIKEGDLTIFYGWPSIWLQMMQEYENRICNLPRKEQQLYVNGAKKLRFAYSSGALLMPSVQHFWQRLRGFPLIVSYTTTELGMTVLETTLDEENIVPASVGYPVSGVKVKLSHGDHGELLVQTPFKSLFQGLKISILEVEAGLAELSYISEAAVVAVPDPENGHRIAALLRLSARQGEVTLGLLRTDLARHLPQYKLPTLLRILSDSENLPKTRSGKVMREAAQKAMFPKAPEAAIQTLPREVQVWCVDTWNDGWTRRAWDFWE
ncbi:hypothetical protein ABW20_dc0110498 [Dactylellina cionopaga]|nr:hypothetical protein ABW20_dc0110498 [Dactylellina cionopaga]